MAVTYAETCALQLNCRRTTNNTKSGLKSDTYNKWISNPQPPSKNDIELKEKESTQKNMLKVAELIRKKKEETTRFASSFI